MSKNLFCFGFGYSANALSTILDSDKWNIQGTKRIPGSIDNTIITNILPFSSDQTLKNASSILSSVTHILVSIPPGINGDPVLFAHVKDIISAPCVEWIGYLSTTGVYGNTEGKIVNEESECNPTNERSRRRVIAENDWLKLFHNYNLPVQVFRLAGIYGPDRSAIESIKNKKARRINMPGHAFSRIHVEDIAQILLASINNPHPGRVYNVCDNEAAPGSDVVEYACKLMGVKVPPLISLSEAQLSPMAKSFYKDNRRIDNKRIREELSVDLLYPTYREGLSAILDR